MKYQNKKNNRIAELVQESEKFGTVLLVFEDGSDTQVTNATLKRWWKKLPEEEVVEVTPDPVETVPEEKTENELVQMPGTDGNWGEEHWAPEEDVAGDGTPLAEVGKEIAAQAKERAKQIAAGKKARKPKEKTPAIDVTPVIDYITEVADRYELSPYTRDRQPGLINFKPETGSVLFYTMGQKRSLWLFAKSKQLGQELSDMGVEINCLFDRKFNVSELNDETKVLIDKIIEAVVANQSQKVKKGE